MVHDRRGERGRAVLAEDQHRVAHARLGRAVQLDDGVGAVGRLVELVGLHRTEIRAAAGREREAQGCGGEHETAGTAHGGLLFGAAQGGGDDRGQL
eukprot:Nk52_evm1s2183 gene=Nk52_evmTU1s2183